MDEIKINMSKEKYLPSNHYIITRKKKLERREIKSNTPLNFLFHHNESIKMFELFVEDIK